MRLWIIGNGFDLAHRLQTNYSDYRKYLIDTGESWLEFYFGNDGSEHKNLLWSDMENALGIYNIEDIYSFLKDGHMLDMTDISQYVEEIDAEVKYHFVGLCEKFTETFRNWIHKIDLNPVSMNTKFVFQQTDLFLSFNYTDTLEYVYRIDEDRALHIHGRASRQEKLIMGHNQTAKMPMTIKADILDNAANYRAHH